MSLNTSLGSIDEFEFGKGCQQIAARLPVVAVNLPSIASYDVLVPAMVATACATTGAVA